MDDMDDMISRQEAIKALYTEIIKRRLLDDVNDGMLDEFDTEEILRRLPSAQPEVTRCVECIHWKHSAVRKSYCEAFDWMSKAEDFCSFAERRSDG